MALRVHPRPGGVLGNMGLHGSWEYHMQVGKNVATTYAKKVLWLLWLMDRVVSRIMNFCFRLVYIPTALPNLEQLQRGAESHVPRPLPRSGLCHQCHWAQLLDLGAVLCGWDKVGNLLKQSWG